MKRIFLAAIISVNLICSDIALAKAPTQELLMFEPLFGITYLPSKVKFEPAPADIFQCEDLREPRSRLSLFGKVVKNRSIFYYVYGLMEVDFGAGPTGEFEAEHDDGIIVVVSPRGCRDIGAGYAWSNGQEFRRQATEIGITEDVASALLSDAVEREVKAFGGIPIFLAKVKAAGLPESYLHPYLRAKLKQLRDRAEKASRVRAKGRGRQ